MAPTENAVEDRAPRKGWDVEMHASMGDSATPISPVHGHKRSSAKSLSTSTDEGRPLSSERRGQTLMGSKEQKHQQYQMLRMSILDKAGTVRRSSTDIKEDVVKIMDTGIFVHFFGFVCFLNMLIIGLEVNFTCVSKKVSWCTMADRGQWYYIEVLFTVLFTLEMAIRIKCLSPILYFKGDILANPWGVAVLRCMDFFIVFLRIFDTFIFEVAGFATPIKIISCFRIAHLATIIRRNPTMKHFREVWMILHSFGNAGRVVFWTLVLMFVFLCVFGVVMTDLVIKQGGSDKYDYSKSAWTEKPWTVEDYWGTVPRSIFSLFQIVTLDRWCSSLVRPLVTAHPAFMWIIIPFLVMTVLSMMNVIVAVIVESTMRSAAANQEKVVKEREKAHLKVVDSLKRIFLDADLDGSGDLDREELDSAIAQTYVKARLKFLELRPKDLTNLFELLDPDKTGAVPTDNFFRGCARLRGLAQSTDMHQMAVDFGRCHSWCKGMVDSYKETNTSLWEVLLAIESLDLDIVKSEVDEKDPVLLARRVRLKKLHGLDSEDHDLSMDRYLHLGENDSNVSSEVWEGDDDDEDHHHHHHHHKHKGAGTLVLSSLKNTKDYDEIVESSNVWRHDHGQAEHETYRQEYGSAMKRWEAHGGKSHGRKSKAFDEDAHAQESLGEPTLMERRKYSAHAMS